jgi:hypothetical protein
MHKITLTIPADMHDALQRRAQATGKLMTALVREAIAHFLAMEAAVRHVKDGQDVKRME